MFHLKHSPRLRYRKCYFLLSALTTCLIIFYCIICHKQNLMLLTLFNKNNNSNSNNNINNNESSISKSILQNLTKKHVVDSNKELRDWHNGLKYKKRLQVTRDHPNYGTSYRSNKQQQQLQPEQTKNPYQPQGKILNVAKSKFGQMATITSTYNMKWIENKNAIRNSSNNNYQYNKKNWQLTGFNVELSDSLPLQRSIPDTRHESCRTKSYPAHLPQCSIIIIYHNEHASVLLRNLYAIANRTPQKLLKEIILIDDYSDMDVELEQLIKIPLPVLVKLVHLPRREGLIRARIQGAKAARGEILVFLDAHVEVNVDWLPPLLKPIMEDGTTCTTPIIDVIKYDTLEYRGSLPSRGGFNWEFNYVQLPVLKGEINLEFQPHNNPIMNGGLFAMRREYFWLLGGYDEGLEIWGAEQFELSFKIWLCGGRILEVPCSRVGHLYRDPNFRVNYTDRKDDFISKNYKRVAEVWMDEYKEYLYENIPKLNQIPAGDLEQQKLLRKKLKCKPFKWFLDNIAPDILKSYPPIKPSDFALGAIQSLAAPKLCLDLGSTENRQILKEVLKPCSPDLKYPYAAQKFHLGFRHDLRHQGNCLEVQTWSARAPIWLWPCHNLGGNQYWYYDRSTQMLVHGKTDFTQRCLELDTENLEIYVDYCDFAKPEQKWHIGYINHTAMKHFFEE